MFAGCMERMKQDSCGGCARKDPCHFLFRDLLGIGRGESRHGEAAKRSVHPFMAFLGQLAGAAEARSKSRPGPFRREVERRLEAMLASGPLRADELARDLGIGRQTLYRRLKAEGTTYEEVLDALRRRLALRLIGKEGAPVKEAAWRLGFSDPAAFSRAFKRWTGSSPAAWRSRRPRRGA